MPSADHGGRHHREGQHARCEEVDRVVDPLRGGQHVDEREEHEQQQRDADADEELLAVGAG
jgi:hypothetical protein